MGVESVLFGRPQNGERGDEVVQDKTGSSVLPWLEEKVGGRRGQRKQEAAKYLLLPSSGSHWRKMNCN